MLYPKIAESWRNHWENISSIFGYPEDIHRAIYTTNAIESLNSVIRHATKRRKIFLADSDDGLRYIRIVKYSKQIGIDKFTGKPTSTFTIMTDKFGNLITTTPGIMK